MKGSRRTVLFILSLIGTIGLLALLLKVSGATLSDVIYALVSIPMWVHIIVFLITAFNEFIGALKWHSAISWLSPNVSTPNLLEMTRLTTIGTALGQVTQTQASVAFVRWIAVRRGGKADGWIVGTTLYEQLFDLLLIITAGLASVVIVMAVPRFDLGIAIWAGTMIISVFGMQLAFRLSARLCHSARDIPHIGQRLSQYAEAFEKAGNCPFVVSLVLAGWSLLRLIILIIRFVVVAAVLAPDAKSIIVAAGYPVTALFSALPITPGAFGVAEWAWTGVYVGAGSSPATAAVTALAFRVTTLFHLCLFLLTMQALYVFSRLKND